MNSLLVIGSTNTDLTVQLPSLPLPGQTVLGGTFLSGPGGKGANQAVAAARAGAKVSFVTALGDDSFGQQARASLHREGISLAHAIGLSDQASGVALILVGQEGENMIGVAPGANAAILPEHVQKIPAEVFAPGEWLLVAGLEIPIGTVTAVVHRAARVGMKVVLNPAPSDSRLLKAGILHAVDVITPNRVELWQLTGISTGDEEGILEAAASLRAHGPRAVVVTLGAEGCLIAEENAVRRIPAHQVKAIDTVGAGDAFSGALAVALAEGRSLVEASGWASAAAALAVTLPGAQTALPTRAEIDRLASMRIA